MDGLVSGYTYKYNKESKNTWIEQKYCKLCARTSYLTLLDIILIKLPIHQEVCDVTLKTCISLSSTRKFLHTIKNNDDVKVAFDEYVNDVIHMVLIYTRKNKNIY